MRESLYINAKAMDICKDSMGVIANNLSNINTIGYKKDNVYVTSFQNLMVRNINNQQSPHIPDQINCQTDFSPGAFRFSDDKMNVAIDGKGFFKVKLENGQIAYTRRGNFKLDKFNNLTVGMHQVMGTDGPITLNDTDIFVDEKGKIFNAKGEFLQQLDVVSFADTRELEKIGGSLFVLKEGSRQREIDADVQIKHRFLEESNVDAMSSMIEMIGLMESMRQYETQQKVVQLNDDATSRMISQIGRL